MWPSRRCRLWRTRLCPISRQRARSSSAPAVTTSRNRLASSADDWHVFQSPSTAASNARLVANQASRCGTHIAVTVISCPLRSTTTAVSDPGDTTEPYLLRSSGPLIGTPPILLRRSPLRKPACSALGARPMMKSFGPTRAGTLQPDGSGFLPRKLSRAFLLACRNWPAGVGGSGKDRLLGSLVHPCPVQTLFPGHSTR